MSVVADPFEQMESTLTVLDTRIKKELSRFASVSFTPLPWDQVSKSKKSLYEAMGSVLSDLVAVENLLTEVTSVVLAIRSLLWSISKYKYQIPLVQLQAYQKHLKRRLEQFKEYRQALDSQRQKYEHIARFYNSTQYMMTSSRLDHMA